MVYPSVSTITCSRFGHVDDESVLGTGVRDFGDAGLMILRAYCYRGPVGEKDMLATMTCSQQGDVGIGSTWALIAQMIMSLLLRRPES
jgi:hypothetical protein